MNAKRTVPHAELEAHPMEVLLQEVALLNVSPTAKLKFMQVLRSMAGERVTFKHSLLTKPAKVNLAVRLLDDGLSVPEIREALRERVKVGRSGAYVLIEAALNARIGQKQQGLFVDSYGEDDRHG